jgi:hypothetical protein
VDFVSATSVIYLLLFAAKISSTRDGNGGRRRIGDERKPIGPDEARRVLAILQPDLQLDLPPDLPSDLQTDLRFVGLFVIPRTK